MLKRIAAGVRRAFQGPAPNRAAQHWDEWQRERNAAPTQYVDWGDHPTVLALVYRELFGSPTTSMIDFLKTAYPSFAQARALSLCSGDGAFEKVLVEQGVFGSVTGTDLSPVRVEQANRNRGEYAGRLEYRLMDVNQGDFGAGCYDVVFAKAALHHVQELEAMFEGVRRCLRPGGRLVTLDFFGPTRFQWTDRQLELANRFLAQEIPEALLRRADGSVHRNISRPSVEQMIAIDPSEAVRSAEIHGQLAGGFEIERQFDAGGALLNLIFDGTVVNNFQAGNPAHDALVERAFRYERDCMARGEIGSDFKFIIAKPRETGAP
jgi:SAM-dependent methyltransferase